VTLIDFATLACQTIGTREQGSPKQRRNHRAAKTTGRCERKPEPDGDRRKTTHKKHQRRRSKMTKIEKIHDLLEDIETDVRSQLIKDILATIKDFQDGCPKNQEDGLQAAVEIIQQNYILG
jgi:hypothetical protein